MTMKYAQKLTSNTKNYRINYTRVNVRERKSESGVYKTDGIPHNATISNRDPFRVHASDVPTFNYTRRSLARHETPIRQWNCVGSECGSCVKRLIVRRFPGRPFCPLRKRGSTPEETGRWERNG